MHTIYINYLHVLFKCNLNENYGTANYQACSPSYRFTIFWLEKQNNKCRIINISKSIFILRKDRKEINLERREYESVNKHLLG